MDKIQQLADDVANCTYVCIVCLFACGLILIGCVHVFRQTKEVRNQIDSLLHQSHETIKALRSLRAQ